jgi:hypothetical protein
MENKKMTLEIALNAGTKDISSVLAGESKPDIAKTDDTKDKKKLTFMGLVNKIRDITPYTILDTFIHGILTIPKISSIITKGLGVIAVGIITAVVGTGVWDWLKNKFGKKDDEETNESYGLIDEITRDMTTSDTFTESLDNAYAGIEGKDKEEKVSIELDLQGDDITKPIKDLDDQEVTVKSIVDIDTSGAKRAESELNGINMAAPVEGFTSALDVSYAKEKELIGQLSASYSGLSTVMGDVISKMHQISTGQAAPEAPKPQHTKQVSIFDSDPQYTGDIQNLFTRVMSLLRLRGTVTVQNTA